MADLMGQVKHYGGFLGKGLLQELTPTVTAGLISELFQQWNVTLESITNDIQYNRSLWAGMSDEEKHQLAHAAKQLGTLDFFTPGFFINAITKDFPAIASLFLNWMMAGEWLARQITELKEGVASLNIDKNELTP